MTDTDTDARTFWETRYGDGHANWSGNANPLFVDHVTDLTPGTALELGSGEGADAIWLAERGWTVLATDIAEAALRTAAKAAEAVGAAGVAGRISWQQYDLGVSFPDGEFDLVTASYLQSPVELPRTEILRRAADHVAPGGVLLVVGHAGWPTWITDGRSTEDVPTAAELIAALSLPSPEWTVEHRIDVEHPMTGPDGHPGTRSDSVVRWRRSR